MIYDIFTIQDLLRRGLEKAASQMGAEGVPALLEAPKDPNHGDFASPLAMNLAKKLRKSPLALAEELKTRFTLDEPIVESLSVAAPGFLNIRLKPSVFHSALAHALEQGGQYGRTEKEKGRKVLLEFVSANPTGPLNVVSARAAALGDSISNLLQAAGAEVAKEYYVNDTGVQARLFGESLLAACDRAKGGNTQAPDNGYQGAYMNDLAKEYLEIKEPRPEPGEWGMGRVLDWHKKTLESYGVHFDRFFSEKKELHATGKVEKTVELIKQKGLAYENDGALWIKVSEYGSPKDEVLVKSDGLPAYFAADIAYHLGKFERGYTELVDIWGPDHHGHIQRMTSALIALGNKPEGFKVLIAQQVNLLQGGEKMKMSKREGKFVTMDELLEEAGKDAARFFFVMRGANSHLDFDLEVAKKQTDENPVYYVQYAHARICSLLKKTAERGFVPALDGEKMGTLTHPEESALLKRILEFPQQVVESGKAHEPHRLVAYLQVLAAEFHLFYSKHRILDASPEVANARLSLALGVKNVLRNALALLGVSSPEQM